MRRFEQAGYLEELVAQLSRLRQGTRYQGRPADSQGNAGQDVRLPVHAGSERPDRGRGSEIAHGSKYLLALRKALNEMARMFFEIQYTARAIANLRETKALFSQMAQSAQARLETGQAVQADVLKAQSELAMVENRLGYARNANS